MQQGGGGAGYTSGVAKGGQARAYAQATITNAQAILKFEVIFSKRQLNELNYNSP